MPAATLTNYDARYWEYGPSPYEAWGNATVLVKWHRNDRYFYLDSIKVRADKRKEGIGSKILQAICAEADQTWAPIALVIDTHRSFSTVPRSAVGQVTDSRVLTAWYTKHGFVVDSDLLLKLTGIYIPPGIHNGSSAWLVREPEFPIRSPTEDEDLTPEQMWFRAGSIRRDE